MFRRFLVSGLAVLTLTATVGAGRTCGFEDPNSAAMQRVMLNLVYPNAVYAHGAADKALRTGMLRPTHFTRPGDFFALQRTTRNLQRFADILADGAGPDLPAFSMVLMGPVLWARFVPGAGGLAAETHVAEPLPHKVVVVTDVPALAALVQGDLSGEDANASGLLRLYGDPSEIESLRLALAAAFPGASNSSRTATGKVDQARRKAAAQ